jgi:FKBP-type peptidyl-prolyl cis-trans isomerase
MNQGIEAAMIDAKQKQQEIQQQIAAFNAPEFKENINQMNNAANNFSTAVSQWAANGNVIADKLASAKDMSVTAQHQVNVNITGLAGMQPGIEKMVTDAVNKALGAKNPLNADKPPQMVG